MEDRTRLLLASPRPSRRSFAIDELRRRATPLDLPELRNAMQSETVPALRRQLSDIVRTLSHPSKPGGGADPLDRSVSRVERERFEEDAVHWMRHELEPGMGWLQLAASDEIRGFEESETYAAIEGLQQRIASVEALIRVSAPPRYERVALSEVVQDAARIGGAQQRLSLDLISDRPDGITTDPNLLRLILSNAMRNAIDAVLEVATGDPHVNVLADVGPDTFWVRISNQFVGSDFSFDEVSGTGVSAKIGHQGQGFSIMRIAATRLNYELQMQAEAGHAILTLRGSRRNG